MNNNESRINRRNFLWNTGLGVAGAAILQNCAPTAEAPSGQSAEQTGTAAGSYGSFHMGFQSYSLRHFSELDDFLREAAKLRLPYVELYNGHLSPQASPETIQRMKDRLAEMGMQANAFGVERFTADHSSNEALFQFGRALGVRNLSASPTRDAFESLSRLVEQYDIRIAIHNHGPEDETWRMPEWILDAVGNLDPRIGACVDTGHFIRAGVDPVQAIELLGTRVLGVHFKDFNQAGEETVLGQGQLDVKGALTALQDTGFDGVFSLEFELDPEDPVPGMQESLQVIQENLKETSPAPPPTAGSAR